MIPRIITFFILLLALGTMPFWIYMPAIVIAVMFFPFYFEAIILGFLVDVLYGSHISSGLSFVFPFTLFLSVFIIIILPIRERLRLGY